MHVSYEKLQGLDRDRVVSAILPVLRAHDVAAVELIWRMDNQGRVLYLTVERPGTTEPGAGVTLDLCSEISRDVSAALDVSDAIDGKYRLEVGSPGVERALYNASDYARFAGRAAKVKLRQALDGRLSVRGTLRGLDDAGCVVIESDAGELRILPEQIENGQLVFEWHRANGGRTGKPGRRGRSSRS